MGWIGLLCAALAAGPASADTLVVVGPAREDRILASLELALRQVHAPEPLSGAALKPALKRLNLGPRDLADEAQVAKLARELKAVGFLVARAKGRGKKAGELDVSLYDAEGRLLWMKSEPLQKGRLSSQAAQRLAQSVEETFPPGPASSAPRGAAPRSEERVAAAKPAPVAVAPEPAPVAPEVPAKEPARPSSAETGSAAAKPAVAAESLVPVPASASGAYQDPDYPESGAVAVERRPERSHVGSAAIPLVEVSAGAVVLWRNQEFCPGVQQCGQKTFNPGSTVRYVTDAPYLGPAVRAQVFPLAWIDSPLRGLGLTGGYARGAVETAVTDPSTGQEQTLPGQDEEFSAEVVYRYGFRLGWGEPSIGVRGGVVGRSFVLPANAVIVESRRRTGPVFGAEAALPLREPHVRLEVSARYAVAPVPGTAERQAYGTGPVTSSGVLASAGLTGQLSGGWGYSVTAEYAGFRDTFTGTGQRADGGAAHEEYLGVAGLLRYRF